MFDKIYKKLMSRLEKSLPSWLYYHSPDHTRYVLEKAIFLAEKESVSGKDLLLLKIAAVYHDAGFLVGPKDHERTGCRIAAEDLQKYDLSNKDIEKICGMIMATRIPQKPNTRLERILADADLEYLGTDKFEEFGQDLYKERLHLDPRLSLDDWNKVQVEFISNHQYHTNFCKTYREPIKQENLRLLLQEIDQ
ncbi:uncharacterized protein SAMN04488034_103274 [Salinimicrobium catena]|uniref:HD domain-containing protein n=1 Tax=Salinimicrobium catena TaxID=390640 RepID=A0A1H5N4M8_9FLAO|nr:HD domain-containing protein [Salinimicrobium catena]SDL34866.1 uncharacterized protein SAMN04488140_103274 [Salinimicrobium catena]SEE95608.1 uncharacterized protein SAMN04488034_103274 [Salinimicrobium catena]